MFKVSKVFGPSYKQRVGGSNPSTPTQSLRFLEGFFVFNPKNHSPVVSYISFTYLYHIKINKMEALLEKTTREDQRIAKTSVDRLRKASQRSSQSRKPIEITLEGSHETVRLPRRAVSLLNAILSNMAAGKSMALILSDTTIGTQEAAEFLEVSRPYVVRLLENGEIPFRKQELTGESG